MLLFAGSLYDRSSAGSCLLTSYTDSSVSTVYDDTDRFEPSIWIEALYASLAVYYSDPGFTVGSVRVEVGEFRPEQSFSRSGDYAASIEACWGDFKDVGVRISSYPGAWSVFTIASYPIEGVAPKQPLPTNLPLAVEISVANGVRVFAGATPSLVLDDPLNEPLSGGAWGFVRLDFAVQRGSANAYRRPSFFGDVKIYLEPYEPPADPDAFWTNLVGAKETV